MAAASRVINRLHLEDFGLRWCHAPAVLGHSLPNGRWVMLHRDLDVTAKLLDEEHPGDGDAWRVLMINGGGSVRAGGRFGHAVPAAGSRGTDHDQVTAVGGLSFVREMLAPASTAFEQQFGSQAVRLLLAGNALHADIPLDGSGRASSGCC